jgi:hypothetical protein
MIAIDASEYERAAAQLVADAQEVVDRADALSRARDARQRSAPSAREHSARALLLRKGAAIARSSRALAARARARVVARLAQIRLTE